MVSSRDTPFELDSFNTDRMDDDKGDDQQFEQLSSNGWRDSDTEVADEMAMIHDMIHSYVRYEEC
jgi:hypothetical protein